MHPGKRLLTRWHAYLFGPVSTLRVQLFWRSVLVLLAFDCWTQHAAHAGRYGVGGFNVAHFTWLDRLQPLPTPALYVGLMTFCGLLALWSACTGPTQLGLAVLAATYTYSWAMSMLDSYQHHYLLSLWLMCGALLPWSTLNAAAAQPQDLWRHTHVSAWGQVLLWTLCALVYSATGLSKLEADWRGGFALRHLTNAVPTLHSLVATTRAMLGLRSTQPLWAGAAHAVIAVQWLIAAAYLSAVQLDRRPTAGHKWLALLGLVAACSFHLGAEALRLKIGWFSAYMIIAALCALTPHRWLVAAMQALMTVRPQGRPLRPPASAATPPWLRAGSPLLAAGLALAVVSGIELPGMALGSLVACAAGLLLWLWPAAPRHRSRWAPALVGWALVAAVHLSHVRFDYHRFAAMAAFQRGQWQAALRGYRLAERYAPQGRSRLKRIRLLERRLGLPPSGS